MRALPPLLAFTAVAGCAAASQPEFVLNFFVREAMIYEPIEVGGHPCGLVTPVRLTRIPVFPENGPIEHSEAVEFDGRGDIIGTWRLPADYTIEGVRGDRLLVDIGDLFWVGQDGSLELAPDIEVETSELRSCPTGIVDHYSAEVENAYLRCTTLQDRRTGADRHIAYEGVCT